jgi:hypothetical protein
LSNDEFTTNKYTVVTGVVVLVVLAVICFAFAFHKICVRRGFRKVHGRRLLIDDPNVDKVLFSGYQTKKLGQLPQTPHVTIRHREERTR